MKKVMTCLVWLGLNSGCGPQPQGLLEGPVTVTPLPTPGACIYEINVTAKASNPRFHVYYEVRRFPGGPEVRDGDGLGEVTATLGGFSTVAFCQWDDQGNMGPDEEFNYCQKSPFKG